jgi:hypothetical protein
MRDDCPEPARAVAAKPHHRNCAMEKIAEHGRFRNLDAARFKITGVKFQDL